MSLSVCYFTPNSGTKAAFMQWAKVKGLKKAA